jgi:hypothetical protein
MADRGRKALPVDNRLCNDKCVYSLPPRANPDTCRTETARVQPPSSSSTPPRPPPAQSKTKWRH